MSERHFDQISRVRLMASGSATWDLSKNDTAALLTVLDDRDKLLAAAIAARDRLRQAYNGTQARFCGGMPDEEIVLLDRLNAAIAAAEGSKP